jgi:serine/threonine-protein phosphatase 5
LFTNELPFIQVVKRAPADKDAKAKMIECEKIVRRVEFEKAIMVSYLSSIHFPFV